MLPTVWTDRPWQKIFQAISKQRDPWFLRLNGLTLLLLGVLSIYAKVKHKGWGIQLLFTDPFYHPYSGILTGVSEILWCLPVTVCTFSVFSISKGKPRRYTKRFLIASALLLSVLLLDDRFRITLILVGYFGVPKTLMLALYGTATVIYAAAFWRRIRTTAYTPLILAIILFVISGLADLLHLPGQGTPAMLEDGTKLLGNINLAIYFWQVCQQEVWRSLKNS